MIDDQDPSLTRPPPSVITILLSRTISTSGTHSPTTCNLTTLLRTPHRRAGLDDPLRHDLEYCTFLDSPRGGFSNLDALLTRVGKVDAVYLGCAEDDGKSGGSARKDDLPNLLCKLASVIESRVDIFPSATEATTIKILPFLSKPKATQLAEQSLPHLLGGESSPHYLAYRGDKRIATDSNIQWCIGLFFHADPSHCHLETVGLHSIRFGTLASRVTMDRTAAEAIHLLPPRNSGESFTIGGNAGNNSLYGVLNQCKTKMGSRLLEVWLRQPLVDLGGIQRRQEAVSKLVTDGIGRDRLRDEGLVGLRHLDVDGLGYRLANYESLGSTSKALECLYKMHLLGDKCLPRILEVLSTLVQEGEGEESSCALQSSYEALQQTHRELNGAVQLAEKVIDFDAAPRDFLVNPSLDSNLLDIKADLDGIDDELQMIHDQINGLWAQISQKQNQVRIEDVDSNSNTSCVWQFRLPNTNDIKLLQQHTDVKVHRLLKNGVYFSTKELEHLGTKKKDLTLEYQQKQRDIVEQVMSVAATYVPVLERAGAVLSELDVLASLAFVAAYSRDGYCRPVMTDGEEDGLGIELVGARHPCVELQDDVSFIPNDFNLVFGSSSFLLVTGPNMGGKSTYIRSLGAIVAMAQIGSFVPCTSAKINVVHHILARVGAGDAQDRGISTFMAEMLEASSILRTSTKRSLIIIDELGRGTSTFDGFGLAKAISEHIIQNIGCITVFATHFHELTALEEQEKSVSNCHVTAHSDAQNGLTFLYEVRPGPCLESFGIQVAEMANMPPSIIADAKRKAKQLENFEYRRKSKFQEEVDDEGQEAVEETAVAMEFLHQFRKLPIDKMSRDEINNTVLPLLRKYGFYPGIGFRPKGLN